MSASHFAGIGFGLGAALCQSLSYLFSRRFMRKTERSALLLLVLSHVVMGALSLAVLAMTGTSRMPRLATYIWPLVGSAYFYLAAQLGLFRVLRCQESSRIAPLLGMKVLVLALLSVAFLHQRLGAFQWTAVGMCVAAAWLLNEAGGRIPWPSLLTLLLTIVGYCLSDINITILVGRVASAGPLAPVTAACMSYVLCAVAVLPFAFRRDACSRRVWGAAAPHALAWFSAMCLLYACFGLIGVVFGNIVQSTRGMMSIALGWAVAHAGMVQIESHAPRAVFWRRMAGALLMTTAIAVYLIGR